MLPFDPEKGLQSYKAQYLLQRELFSVFVQSFSWVKMTFGGDG